MIEKNTLKINYAIHPGITLREKLEELKITPKEFAIRTGKPIKTISNVLNGKSSITSEMAVQFEKVLNIPASFWMAKQANYDEYIAREKEKEELAESLEWSKKFPYNYLAKLGYVPFTRDAKEKAENLLSFFNISKPKSWEEIYINQQVPAFFRISLKKSKNPYSLSAFLRIGEIEASKIDAPPFNKAKLKEVLKNLKDIMNKESEDFLEKIKELSLSAGVKIIFTPALPNTAINGVVRWINDNPVIQITDRFKRYDIFWFSLFHEYGHIILHGNKKDIFLEEIENTKSKSKEEVETEADKFAEEFLLSYKDYNKIIDKLNSLPDKNPSKILNTIKDLAKGLNIHKDIIIGRILFHDKSLYKYGFLQNEIRKIDFEKLLKTQRKSNE
jgi:addiction module HigA family antidote